MPNVIPMRLHLTPLCIAAVDNQAVVSVNEKMRVLEEAAEKNQILFFFHDVQTVGVRVKKVNGVISVSEKLLI
jgi:cobalamin biosynthesis protein CbiG